MDLNENLFTVIIVVLGAIAGLCVGGAKILINKEKGRVANLFLGLVAGASIASIIFLLVIFVI